MSNIAPPYSPGEIFNVNDVYRYPDFKIKILTRHLNQALFINTGDSIALAMKEKFPETFDGYAAVVGYKGMDLFPLGCKITVNFQTCLRKWVAHEYEVLERAQRNERQPYLWDMPMPIEILISPKNKNAKIERYLEGKSREN